MMVLVLNVEEDLLEGLGASVEEELILEEVCVIAELQRRVSTAADQLPQPSVRVGRQQLLGQDVATPPDVDDHGVQRVPSARCRRLTEEDAGVQRQQGGGVSKDLQARHGGRDGSWRTRDRRHLGQAATPGAL